LTELSAFAEVQAAYERGDHADVLRRTEEILAERPGDDAAHELRARALLALGRVQEAEAEAENAVRLDPDEIRYHELLADVLASEGAHRDAADEYRRLAAGRPQLTEWTLAEARERLGAAQPEMGTEAARRALRLDPQNATAQLALAQGLTRLGQARPALEAASRAAALAPGDQGAQETLADAQWLAGDVTAALEGYRALAVQLGAPERDGVVRKARSLVRQRSGWFGRTLSSIPLLFRIALRNGWIRVS
jgi:tetratricopeptide (TPR) repeat protein